jgi:hypothetical protein
MKKLITFMNLYLLQIHKKLLEREGSEPASDSEGENPRAVASRVSPLRAYEG